MKCYLLLHQLTSKLYKPMGTVPPANLKPLSLVEERAARTLVVSFTTLETMEHNLSISYLHIPYLLMHRILQLSIHHNILSEALRPLSIHRLHPAVIHPQIRGRLPLVVLEKD